MIKASTFTSGVTSLFLMPVAIAIATPASPTHQSQSVQIAQTPAGYCTVRVAALNIRARPGGRVIGSLKNGDRVALGVTDGSEGPRWTRIIRPLEGYVWKAYLSRCQYKP
ncbi:MAG: SH3 domain-containing protein [Leptolyngbyaceae cyanobacterium RU_5_1]|nr:SH3 domain-containing protein [Leptolyngbyaceae cyanobacterium RU_5_1]